MNNCGPCEEVFSFHPAGANVLLGDGGVKVLAENASLATLRALVTRAGGEAASDN